MIQSVLGAERAEAEQALERVFRSRVFVKAQRSRRLLRYLVDMAVMDPGAAVKEYTLALEVFDRDADYDPAMDATVRVEASRLRARLREYYDEEGVADPLVIEVPKGRYAALLRRRELPPEMDSEGGELATAGLERVGAERVETTSGRRIRGWWMAAAASLAMLAVAGGLWVRGVPVEGGAAASGKAVTSLAILPIANGTGDATLNGVADGITDELIRQLSEVPALRLTAHGSVFRYRGLAADARAIGRKLGVAKVMTGVLRGGSRGPVLVAEVSDTGDGSVVISRAYPVDMGDLRLVEAGVQRDVLPALGAEMSARDPAMAGMPANGAAYQQFMEGESLAHGGSPEELRAAIQHFERAVALDPRFALGWSGLAAAHAFLGLYFEPPREQMPIAREDARRALELNSRLGEARGTMGVIDLVYDWDPIAAKGEMSLAGAEEAAMGVLSCTAHLLEGSGEPRVAEAMLERRMRYDPESAALIAEMGCVHYYRRDYPQALANYRQAMEEEPRSTVAYWGLGKTLTAMGRPEEAIRALDEFRQRNGFEPPILTSERGCALGHAGRRREAVALVRQMEAQARARFVDPYLIAAVYGAMDDRTSTFLWLGRAIEARSPFVISLPTDPRWDAMRSDARFGEMVERALRGKAEAAHA